jgi:hypothetical protein
MKPDDETGAFDAYVEAMCAKYCQPTEPEHKEALDEPAVVSDRRVV